MIARINQTAGFEFEAIESIMRRSPMRGLDHEIVAVPAPGGLAVGEAWDSFGKRGD